MRLALINLVSNITEKPEAEYPAGIYRDVLIIWQLGEFKEQRAIKRLQRITAFAPNLDTGDPFHRDRQSTIKVAQDALRKIKE
ncbi:MAG: hypothetical protein AAGA16_14980 [Cyanobacteria bacterium P01_E01_bin.35]